MVERVKESKAKAIIKRITRFTKEVKSELKKVIWLNRQQLFSNIVAILVICLFFGIIIWILDFGLSWIVDFALR
ncbi:MAG: preprotein translocase subunit SecE [Clostridiaceae bacterium]|nr:preprotein translocase subunit SecE [Clostridiaceae bacterium]